MDNDGLQINKSAINSPVLLDYLILVQKLVQRKVFLIQYRIHLPPYRAGSAGIQYFIQPISKKVADVIDSRNWQV